MSRGEALLAWYDARRRDLPWRHTTDPYRILVSEVMLQQTQVARVVPAYEAFLQRFPSEVDLARAPLDEILAAWQGLGYPVRARRLREAARIVVADGWPRTAPGLQRLPGVGPYTAAAVASFAFGEQVAAVDTNVRRVLSRWVGEPLGRAALQVTADDEVTGEAGTWNQAVMELGALICRPVPRCEECPVSEQCADPTIYTPPPQQARYHGSIRQVRGDLLRALKDAAGPIPLHEVAPRVSSETPDLEAAMEGLERDGLIVIRPDGVALAD